GPVGRAACGLAGRRGVRGRRVIREVAEAELLDPLVGHAAVEHVVVDAAPALARRGNEAADLVGRPGDPRGHRSTSVGARPAAGSAGSSPWPTAQVLMTRCWP